VDPLPVSDALPPSLSLSLIPTDAILGLKELLGKHPSLAVLSLRDLIEKTFPLANDEDRTVRRTLALFVDSLLPLCPRGAMEPFLPLVVTYVCQSLTHLDEKVRMDSLPVVNSLVSYLGGCASTPALERILPSLQGLLHSSQDTAGSSKNVHLCNPKARAAILTTLVGLCSPSPALHWRHGAGLEEALTVTAGREGEMGGTQGRSTGDRHGSQLALGRDVAVMPYLGSTQAGSSPAMHAPGGGGGQQEAGLLLAGTSGSAPPPGAGGGSGAAAAGGGYSPLSSGSLLSLVAPVALGLWTEAVSNEEPTEEEGKVMSLVLELLTVLLQGQHRVGEPGRGVASGPLGVLLETHLMPHFPFQSVGGKDVKERRIMSVKACEIMAHFLPPPPDQTQPGAPPPSPASRGRHAPEVPGSASPPPATWIRVVYGFLLECLRGTKQRGSTEWDAASLPTDEMHLLLRTLGRFLHQLPLIEVEEGFKATLSLSQRCHALSSARQVCLTFMSEWLLGTAGAPPLRGLNRALLGQWLQSLPKALWECKGEHIETSRSLLSTLLEFGRRATASREALAAFDGIQPALVPFFYTAIPQGGGRKPPRKLWGPFLSLPEDLQRLSLDIISYLTSPSMAMLRGMAACCSHPGLPPHVGRYGVSVVHGARHQMEPGSYMSFMLTVIVSETVRSQVRAQVGRSLLELRGGRAIAEWAAPVLETLLTQPEAPSQRVLTGVARCVAVCAQSAAGDCGVEAPRGGEAARLFPAHLESLLPSMLCDVLWGAHRQAQAVVAAGCSAVPVTEGPHAVQSTVAEAIRAREELWAPLLAQAEAAVQSSQDAEEAAVVLAGLMQELPGLVQRHTEPTWAVVRHIERVAGTVPSASEQAGRLRAVAQYQASRAAAQVV